MTTFAPLHRRLRLALDLSSLLVLGAGLVPACATTQEQETQTTKGEATKTDATKADPPKTDPPKPEVTKTDPPEPNTTVTKVDPPAIPEPDAPQPDPDMDLPRCPTIDWCGSKPLVDAMRYTEIQDPPPDVEGCPSMIERKDRLPKKLLAGQEPPPKETSSIAGVDAEATKGKRAAGDATSCCYEWTIPCPGGRPLLVDGQPWIASLRPGRSWSARLPEPAASPALPEAVRERIADAWLRDALTEHASIASFARARAELEAIAAPAELLRACDRAAEDEVEHARLCFGLAERFGGPAVEPTELPSFAPRGGDAIAVALDTFVEGCVGETIAAACARRAAAVAGDPIARAVLERIADDETEHAALAWRTLAWLARRDGARVLAAVLALADELRPRPAATPAEDPDAGLLLAHGRLDARALAQARALAWREVVDPLLAELRAGTPGVAPADHARTS